jgi:signal transduction histidine kinase
MFSFLRYVAVVCLLITIIGAIAIGTVSRRMMGDELLAATLAQQVASVESFAATIWRAGNPRNPLQPVAPELFQQTSKTYFDRQAFVKTTIFSADVRALYYGSSTIYVTDANKSPLTLFNVTDIQRGQIASRLLNDVYYTAGENAANPRIMVHSIVPIMAAGFTEAQRAACAKPGALGCTPEALVEIYSDITAQFDVLWQFQLMIAGAVVALVLLLIGLILSTASKAEAIISKQHEVNQELTEAAASAEAQSRDKTQFLANVSHELRTPLNAIIGFSEIIKNEAGSMQAEHREHIEDINNSGKHLLSLINDILDFSKAEAGKLQMEWDEVDAGKIVRNSLRLVIPRAETAQVTLVEDLPQGQHLVLVTDGKKLKQVLLNLLSNAVKFTPAGGEVKCAAWEDLATKHVMLQVKDSGIGIAAKDISKVMSAFGQVDSKLSRKYEGTGLGLPLSKKFVEAMGGTFHIESEVNVGTSITISLPRTPEGYEADASAHREEEDVEPA